MSAVPKPRVTINKRDLNIFQKNLINQKWDKSKFGIWDIRDIGKQGEFDILGNWEILKNVGN